MSQTTEQLGVEGIEDPVAEGVVIASAICSVPHYAAACARLDPGDFYAPWCGRVWTALADAPTEPHRSQERLFVAVKASGRYEVEIRALLDQAATDEGELAEMVERVAAARDRRRHATELAAEYRGIVGSDIGGGPLPLVREPVTATNGADPGPADEGRRVGNDPQEHDGETTARALRLRSRVLTEDQLVKLPPPEPLVDSILMRRSLAVMWGKPAAGKTFCALDLGCSVAAGAWWFGHSVAQGPVLYVAAEGTGGLRNRHEAWRQGHNIYAVPDMRWLPEAVNLLERSWVDALCMVAAELAPVLIVLDTLARSMVGGDENSARDMGTAVAAADRLREDTGAAVLLVHHDTKEGSTMRGSSALLGAVDTSIELRAHKTSLVLSCEKQKDGPPFAPVHMHLAAVADSCVLERSGGGDVPAFRPTTLMERVSRALEAMPAGTGLTKQAIEEAVRGRSSTVRLALELLVAEEYVVQDRRGASIDHQSAKPYREVEDPEPGGGTDGDDEEEMPEQF